ncbi:MAG: hypothetical protein JSS35_16120 [Proteobacteria bacterium]|nr:hypothetical protein [Pseudomonadota bacterium]
MAKQPRPERTSSCRCGQVRFRAMGAPMVSAVCYCDDCQAGGRTIEALPEAPAFRDADGGTAYLTYRDDRFACVAGEALLKPYKLREDSPTSRYVASCCNSAMYLKFGPGFWVSTYRARFGGDDLPAIEMRIQTKFRQVGAPLPDDAPASSGTPGKFFARGLAARIAMLLGR